MAEEDVRKRAEKTIAAFKDNIGKLKLPDGASNEMKKVVDLSKMYASDAQSFLDKGDVYTAFASIEYAHGLLDAINELNGQGYGAEGKLEGE